SCSAHVCGDYQTIQRSRELMNPVLAASYSRAMQAALSGGGYSGAGAASSNATARSAAATGRLRKPLFEFKADHIPGDTPEPVDIVDAVMTGIRNYDWSSVFLPLVLILSGSGVVVFFVRDRYHRRRGAETIRLIL